MANAVTLKQIAKRAGVSIGTASRVLNGYDRIDPQRALSVRRAMKEMGYQKSNAAQILVSRRTGSLAKTGNIGVVFAGMSKSWMGNPLTSAYIEGIEQACRGRGFHPLIEFMDSDTTLPSCVRESKVDGMLLKTSANMVLLCKQLPEGLPVVGLSVADASAPISQVVPDNRSAGLQVSEYLWNRGHRRIAFVSMEPDHLQLIPRYQGLEEFLRLKNAFRPELVWMNQVYERIAGPRVSFVDATEALDALWSLPPEQRPTAIVAANDWTAGGIYSAAHRRGVSIPEDLSIVGFDNFVGLCSSLKPELTSYQIPFSETGRIAAICLLDQIQNKEKRSINCIQLVRGQLVERNSVATISADTEI